MRGRPPKKSTHISQVMPHLALGFFWTKKENGLKLDENRINEYRSWTKVDWSNPGLDENSVGRKQVGRKQVGRN